MARWTLQGLNVGIGNLRIIHVPSITAGKFIISNRSAARWHEAGPFYMTALRRCEARAEHGILGHGCRRSVHPCRDHRALRRDPVTMAAPYVTGAEILAHVAGENTPSANAADVAWAGKCAAAIEAIIAERLDTANVTLSAGQEAQLQAAAEQDGAALYNARKAPHGVLTFGPDGDVVRLGRPQSAAWNRCSCAGQDPGSDDDIGAGPSGADHRADNGVSAGNVRAGE